MTQLKSRNKKEVKLHFQCNSFHKVACFLVYFVIINIRIKCFLLCFVVIDICIKCR